MKKLAFALSLLLLSSTSFALDVAGVNVSPTVAVRQKTLLLNGAGVRKAYVFVKVYVGALYTEKKSASTADLLKDPGDKLVRMTFVYKKVDRADIVKAFSEGISNNSPAVAATPDAKAFLSWFTSDFKAGDTVDVSLAPDGTVSATHNGKALGSVRNPALARAVLLIWFGEKPADAGLKKGMLGNG